MHLNNQLNKKIGVHYHLYGVAMIQIYANDTLEIYNMCH